MASQHPFNSSKMPTTADAPAISLASLIHIIYDSQRAPLHCVTLKALRLTCKDLKTAADPYVESMKIIVNHNDLDALKRASFTPYTAHVTLAMHHASDKHVNLNKFCTEISLPNLTSLHIERLDVASLPQLGGSSSWPKLRSLKIWVTDSDISDIDSDYLQSWAETKWPLEELLVAFDSDGAGDKLVTGILGSFPLLKYLSLHNIEKQTVIAIDDAKLAHLERLVLSCPASAENGSSQHVGIISSLCTAEWPNLSALCLRHVNFLPKEMHSFVQTLCFKNLQALNLQHSHISSDDTGRLLQGLQGGQIGTLRLFIPHSALLKFETLSLPLLKSLYMRLTASHPAPVDVPMAAFLKSKLPKLSKLTIKLGHALTWNIPPDSQTESCLSSVQIFKFRSWGISRLVLKYLGRHLLNQNAHTVTVKAQRCGSLDPMFHLLEDVPARLRHTRGLPLKFLTVPVLQFSIRLLFSQLESRFPNLVSFTGEKVEVAGIPLAAQHWIARLEGTRKAIESPFEPQPCVAGSGRWVPSFSLELGSQALLFFLQAHRSTVIVKSITFPVHATTPEEQHAANALLEAFPAAEVTECQLTQEGLYPVPEDFNMN